MSSNRDEKAGRPLGSGTRLVQAGRRAEWTGMPGQPGGIVNPPVWRASTILYEDVAHLRGSFPTRQVIHVHPADLQQLLQRILFDRNR